MTKPNENAEKEARRVVAAYRSGRIKLFTPIGQRNLVVFMECLLEIIDGLRDKQTGNVIVNESGKVRRRKGF